MRTYTLMLFALFMLTSCPNQRAGAEDTISQGQDDETVTAGLEQHSRDASAASIKQLAVICSATESDPWTSELLTLIGSHLGFDPWAKPSTVGHLDVYGPYPGAWNGTQVQVSIVLAGLTTVAELQPQQALGAEVRGWLEEHHADLLWLDGDPAQLHIGAQLTSSAPILFTGVVNDSTLYYDSGKAVCGVYRRHSLSGIIGEVWQLDPQRFADVSKPLKYALITDDSAISITRAARYAKLEMVLPDGQSWIATPAAKSWKELRTIIQEMQSQADALIFCGIGEDGCSEDFLQQAPPANLLEGNRLPAVVLGPSQMDQCGAAVLTIKTAAAADEALKKLGKLLAGRDAASLGVIEPQEMAQYLADSGGALAIQALGDAENNQAPISRSSGK